MPELTVDCDICGGKRRLTDFDDSKCPTCGQEYGYDEAVTISLSDHQWELLRNDYKQRAGMKASGEICRN